eukprot:UN07949
MIIMGIIEGVVFGPLINPSSNLSTLVLNIWANMSLYIYSLVPTYWVIKQYEKQLAANNPYQQKLENNSSLSRDNMNKLSIEEILKTKDGFEIFANHLIREFSIENLFFVFEIMQTKHEIISKKLVDSLDAGFMVPIDIETMGKIRRENNCEINDVNDLRKIWRHIMKQYINANAEFCINISSKSRLGIKQSFNSLEGGGKLVVEAEIIFAESEESTSGQKTAGISVDFDKCTVSKIND